MPNSIITLLRYLSGGLLLLFLAVGCRQDEPILPSVPALPGGADAKISLTLRIPGFQEVNTRAGIQEEMIREITVLMLADEGGIEKIKVKHIIPAGSFRTPPGAPANTVMFNIPVTAGMYKRIALVANASGELAAAGIDVGSTYDALKGAEAAGKFGPKGGTAPDSYIPMYGEYAPAGGLELKAGVSQTIAQELSLIRMLARVDVINATTSGVTLNGISYINPVGNGRIYVDPAGYNAGYMAPTLPGTLQKADGGHTLEGTPAASGGTATYYLCEQPVDSSPLSRYTVSRPCILVRMQWNGHEYYYRLDYTWDGVKGGGTAPYTKGAYMPILRNHRYIFTISAVKGPGFATEEEALKSPENHTNRNIVVTPIVIDDSFTDVVYNNMGHFLAVSRTKMTLSLNRTIASTDNKLELQTNYPHGWKIDCVEADGITAIPNTGWMQVNAPNGSVGAKSAVSVLTQGVGDKEGFLVVRAGRLITRIRVEQNDFCGFGGTAKLLHIGNNDYLTHRYGTKCWMVQNSKEGTPGSTNYYGKVSVGAYYHYTYSSLISQNQNPCPSGWHIPTNDEAESMIAYAKAAPNGIGKFWWGPLGLVNNAFEGALSAYYGWETDGYWVVNPAGLPPGNNGGAAIASKVTYLYTPREQGNMDNATLMSVRCVRDSDY